VVVFQAAKQSSEIPESKLMQTRFSVHNETEHRISNQKPLYPAIRKTCQLKTLWSKDNNKPKLETFLKKKMMLMPQ
jgi:hypothetical protein